MRLRRVPKMRAATREPNVEFGSRVSVETDQSQDASLVFSCLRDAIDQGPKLQRHNLHAYPNLLQVILNQRGHLCAVSIRGTSQNRKLDGLCVRIHQRRLSIRRGGPRESRFLQECPRLLQRPRTVGDRWISPAMIARRDGPPKSRSTALVNEPHDRVTVNRRRDGLPEFKYVKPLHFPRQIWRSLSPRLI